MIIVATIMISSSANPVGAFLRIRIGTIAANQAMVVRLTPARAAPFAGRR